VEGFHGLSIEYMRSTKFMHADGGYNRVVWMPSEIKERLQEFIPGGVYDAIATEKDAMSVADLRAFLEDHHHPVIQRWVAEKETTAESPAIPTVFSAGDIPMTVGGFRVILKNAKITAEKVIILPVKPPAQKGR